MRFVHALVPAMPRYTREFIASRNFHLQLTRSLRRRLFYFGILLPSRQRPKITHEDHDTHHHLISVRISLRNSRKKKVRRNDMRHLSTRVLRSLTSVGRHAFPPPYSLSFGLLNIRSLHNKLDNVLELRRDHGVDVLLLVETWHDPDSSCISRLRQIGFNVAEQARPRSAASNHSVSLNHGGVVIVSPASIPLSPIPVSSKPSTFEFLCVRVCSRSSCIVVLIYRTGPIASLFFNELSNLLDRIMLLNDPVIVAGDFNIHIEHPNDANPSKLLQIFRDYGFGCAVNGPTHNLGGTLDIVFTSSDCPLPCITVHETGLSDHCLLRWTSLLSRPVLEYKTSTYRPWKLLDTDEFRDALSLSPLSVSQSWSSMDVNELATMFDTVITRIADKLIPTKTVRSPKRSSDPWFDDECRFAKRSVRQLERHFKKALSISPEHGYEAYFDWRQSLQRYRSLLNNKRATFWRARLHSERHSPRLFWRSFDALMGRGRAAPAESITAETFLNFFVSKVPTAESLHSDRPSFVDAPGNCSLCDFQPLSKNDIAGFIQRLPNKSTVCDTLPTHLLKSCCDLLIDFLTELFNRSLSEGIFPSSWKQVIITPILKKSSCNPLALNSYRPISRPPSLSKLLEKVVFKQVTAHVENYNLLPCEQSAYRANFSTESAVLKFLSDTLCSFDKGQVTLAAFLDLSAAFDCVDHCTLLHRLKVSIGLNGTVLNWFESFLNNRRTAVKHLKLCTPLVPVKRGVPQGSVLGPLLFSLYVADLVTVVHQHHLQVHLFADDILIYGTSSKTKLDDLSARVSLCLDDVLVWLQCNKLLLNTDKTNFMWCYSSRLKLSPPSCIRIGDFWLPHVASVLYLGVLLDRHLLLCDNVSRTSKTCFAMLRRIRAISHHVPLPLVKSLINSLVLSRLDYLLSAHTGLPKSTLHRLQRVLHAAARTACGAMRYDHVQPLLQHLNWLPIQGRIEHRLATLAYNCQRGLAPPYLSSELKSVASFERRLRSAASGALLQPRVRCPTLGGRAFPVAAARAWNDLPRTVCSIFNPVHFKKACKATLMAKYM